MGEGMSLKSEEAGFIQFGKIAGGNCTPVRSPQQKTTQQALTAV